MLCRMRSGSCFSNSFPFSLFKKARDEMKENGFGGLRLLQTLASSSSKGGNSLLYKENLQNRCMELEIVNVLHLGQRKRASDLLLDLVSKNSSVRVEKFSYILDYCAKTPDPVFAMETWRLMVENMVEVNEQCWIHIIQALSKGGYLKKAFDLLVYLGETDRSTVLMYNSFLNACGQSKNFAKANHCLKLMEDHFVGKSQFTYLLLLELSVQHGNIFLAHDIWKGFNQYYEPSFTSLHKFIWSFSKLRDFASACGALKIMLALMFQGNVAPRFSSSTRYKSWLDIPIPSKNEAAYSMLTAKDNRRVLIPKAENTIKIGGNAVVNDLASSCVEKQTFHWNEGKYPCNVSSCPSTTVFTFNVAHRINPKNVTNHGNLSQSTVAYTLGARVKKILTSSFNTLLHACGKSGKCSLAEELFHQMHYLGLEPSAQAYDGLIQAVISNRGVEHGIEVFKGMKARNLKPCNSTLAALSIGCSNSLDLELAEAFIDQISDAYPKLIYPFNALLSKCLVLDQLESAVKFFSKMRKLNVQSDIRTYELLFCLFGYVNAPYEVGDVFSQEALRKRVHVIEMDMFKNGVEHNLFTLENLIRAFGFEGMIVELLQYLSIAETMFTSTYPGTVTYNIVLHALVEARESNAAISVFKKMIAHEVSLDAATYNIMIDCCSISNCLNAATALLSLMLRSGFPPTTCTYTSLLKVLISSEKLDEVLELFNQFFNVGLEADILLFNTILEMASEKGLLDLTEHVIERLHRAKIQPDTTTCSCVFAAYIYHGFYDTAMEALQVLSMRMISEDNRALHEMKARYEYLVYSEGREVEACIIKIFDIANENLGAALLNLRWCAISGYHISWSPEDSLWAKRLNSLRLFSTG